MRRRRGKGEEPERGERIKQLQVKMKKKASKVTLKWEFV